PAQASRRPAATAVLRRWATMGKSADHPPPGERSARGRVAEMRPGPRGPGPDKPAGPPGGRLLAYADQYWSALMISPPARVTKPATIRTERLSFRKRTEPSANSPFAPPVWNE